MASTVARCRPSQKPASSHLLRLTSKSVGASSSYGRLSVDDGAINACLTTAGSQRVQQDQTDGAMLHVNSTPTFFVNGIPIVGLPDDKQFSFVITSEMNPPKSQAAR